MGNAVCRNEEAVRCRTDKKEQKEAKKIAQNGRRSGRPNRYANRINSRKTEDAKMAKRIRPDGAAPAPPSLQILSSTPTQNGTLKIRLSISDQDLAQIQDSASGHVFLENLISTLLKENPLVSSDPPKKSWQPLLGSIPEAKSVREQ